METAAQGLLRIALLGCRLMPLLRPDGTPILFEDTHGVTNARTLENVLGEALCDISRRWLDASDTLEGNNMLTVTSEADENDALYVPEGGWAAAPRLARLRGGEGGAAGDDGADEGGAAGDDGGEASPQWLGSDDATTCVVLILVSSSHVCVAHVNSGPAGAAALGAMSMAVAEAC